LTPCLEELETAFALFEQAGDHRHACTVRSGIGAIYANLGDLDRSVELLREVITCAERLALAEIVANGQRELARVLGWRNEFTEAEQLARMAIVTFAARGGSQEQGMAMLTLAEILIAMSRSADAAIEAEGAMAALAGAPAGRSVALALLARARLRSGQREEASQLAHSAYYGALEAFGTMGDGETIVRLVYAECLLACSDVESARLILGRGREFLLARAATLGSRASRDNFLERVPHNAEILRLADANLGPARTLDASTNSPLRLIKK
jgi:tetratricopeptide (TPR) repeat protein